MAPTVDIQIACARADLPSEADFTRWVRTSLPRDRQDAELTIRIVDIEESHTLNARYRHKDKPTNVLSFPSDLPDELQLPLLGDVVICAPVVAEEARAQGKASEAHWAHMVVHGILHLLGYDHELDQEARLMEGLETDILTGLGYAAPYGPEVVK